MVSKEPTQEQAKKLWEKCGWRHCESNLWLDPEGYSVLSKDSESLPISIDLNSLFKWAVLGAVKRLGDADLSSDEEAMWKLFELWLKTYWTPRTEPLSIEDALFWTINRIMEGDG